jgi:cytochrome c556
MKQTMRMLITVALILATSAAAHAQTDEGYIAYRQELMEGIGADIGAIGDILKYGLPLTENIVGHAESLSRHADLIVPAFEKRVVEGPTDAKAEIWDDFDAFKKATADYKAAAEKLADVARGGDAGAIGAQVKEVGKTCGGCHQPYRKPKEQSFKRH